MTHSRPSDEARSGRPGRFLLRGTHGALAIAVLALTGASCGSSKKQQPTQIPNPASVYCEKSGGKVDFVTTANGTAGYCNLPDGTRIDEWEYFRQHNP
jgi:uncharacterized protein